MANQFTSVLTTPGIGDNTVKTAYDLILEFQLRETPMYRRWVDKRPEKQSQPGSSVVLNRYDWFDQTAVNLAKVPLNEELDVDSIKLPPTVPVTLTFNEYGTAVTRTRKLTAFSFADVDMDAALAVSAHMADTLDELVQDIMVTGTQVFFGGNATSEATIDSADTLATGDIQKAVTKLRTNKVVPWGPAAFFAAGIHPHVVHDIRRESGSGGWRVPNEYASGMRDNLWNGEFGEYEGVRYVQNTRTRRTQTGTGGTQANSVYRTYFHGRQAIAEGVYEEPGVVLGPVVDQLQRFRTVGWLGLLGWALYRNEALVQVLTGSSVATI